jgi:tRNA G10  N-methylase Trm11
VTALTARSRPTEASRDTGWKKRLGQYFTHEHLARLLATLAEADRAATLIDPMVGTGNMLRGALAAGARSRVFAGVEIDPACLALARRQFRGSVLADSLLVEGDAFALSTHKQLPLLSWDLVITNPPYVRYQSTAGVGGDSQIPSATAVRVGLLRSLEALTDLSRADRDLVLGLAMTYSGLADLAVPAWLLCAALVGVGGTLAMVVPDTWLSRDYARPVQYLLGRCFDVEYVVRDVDAVWFKDAVVRTTLVVAKRVQTRETAFDSSRNSGHIEISLGRGAGDSRSMVGALHDQALAPDLEFAREARRWLCEREGPRSETLSVTWVPYAHTATELQRAVRGEKWVAAAESQGASRQVVGGGPTVPLRLAAAIGGNDRRFLCLEDLGWRVGQGLRTGANTFFYGEASGADAAEAQVATSRRIGGEIVAVPANVALPVVRNQADLPDSCVLGADAVRGRVLVLTEYALPEHVNHGASRPAYRVMTSQLAEYVRRAAQTNVGSKDDPKLIPELSAVHTNARGAERNGTGLTRYWYHLPPFTLRHRPDLLLPRVNHIHPRILLNPGRAVIVDANFSTLWRDDADASVGSDAMLAFMSSTWTKCVLELLGTVMGGGALKVEATHLRRLPVPQMGADTWRELGELGRALVHQVHHREDCLLDQIDAAILGELGSGRPARLVRAVRGIAAEVLAGRRQ